MHFKKNIDGILFNKYNKNNEAKIWPLLMGSEI